MKRCVIILLSVFLLTACAIKLGTGNDKINTIQVGMSEAQILEKLGKPDERYVAHEGHYVVLGYIRSTRLNFLFIDIGRDKYSNRMCFVLEDDKLTRSYDTYDTLHCG